MFIEQFDRIGAPRDLVQVLPAPVSKAATLALMRQCDLVVATGSQANVKAAYSLRHAGLRRRRRQRRQHRRRQRRHRPAADRIVLSKTFDHATSCSSENSLVAVGAAYDAMVAALQQRGAVLLDASQKARLQAAMFPDGKLSGLATGQAATVVAERAGLAELAARAPNMLLVEETGFGAGHPFSGEKLCPVLALYARATSPMPSASSAASTAGRVPGIRWACTHGGPGRRSSWAWSCRCRA
jgi:sulfoacetaldehyde dehydrogenase